MAYLCRDCGYRGRKGSRLGGCQACGSFNVGHEVAPPKAAAPAADRSRLTVLIVVWAVFIGLVAWKLVS